MKTIYLFILLSIPTLSFSQDIDWIKTEGEITEITIHPGRKTRETAVIKFNLEDGTEQFGSTDLFRIPFVGSMKSVGDTISINYDKNNPFLIQTVVGTFLSTYGMYILIFFGIILSLKPFLKKKKKLE
jgi:hypothetical protein